jgi:hypothetical protein
MALGTAEFGGDFGGKAKVHHPPSPSARAAGASSKRPIAARTASRIMGRMEARLAGLMGGHEPPYHAMFIAQRASS